MEYVTLGSTGLQVSPLCLGTWRFGRVHEGSGVMETKRDEARAVLDAYAERGGNFIDTSNNYGDGRSETWIGEWLQERDREDYVIASKCYWANVSRFTHNLSRKNVRAEVEGSLDRLGTDYLDVFYLHRWDEDTPIETTLRTVDDLVSEGKIHHVGISTADAWKVVKGLWTADVNNYERFEVAQPMFHAAFSDEVTDYLDVCADQDIAVCPYSPLAGGFLTGKYRRAGDDPKAYEAPDGSRGDIADKFENYYLSERGWQVLDAVEAVADELDATNPQVALRWLIEQPGFTCVPIMGARNPDQVADNFGALDVSLSDEQFNRIVDARYAGTDDGDGNGDRWGYR